MDFGGQFARARRVVSRAARISWTIGHQLHLKSVIALVLRRDSDDIFYLGGMLLVDTT